MYLSRRKVEIIYVMNTAFLKPFNVTDPGLTNPSDARSYNILPPAIQPLVSSNAKRSQTLNILKNSRRLRKQGDEIPKNQPAQ